jgi:tetratricopeptide (TPR) repeat protein
MVPVNISDNLKIIGRSLHLETQYNPEDHYLIQTLYEQGQVLSRIRNNVSNKMARTEFSQWISDRHQETREMLRFLSEAREKIRSLRHYRSLVSLGKLYLLWGLTDEAIDVFKVAADSESDSCLNAHTQLVEAYLRRSDTQKALEVINPLLSRYPEDHELWFERSKIYLEEKKYDQSFDDASNAIQRHPESEAYYLVAVLSGLYLTMNKGPIPEFKSQDSGVRICMKNLAESLKRADRFNQTQLDPILKSIQMGALSEAAVRLRRFIDSLSNEDGGLYDLFYLFILYGDQEKKTEILKQYIIRMRLFAKRHPTNPRYHRNLGIGFVVQCREQFQQVLNEFHTAQSLDGEMICHELIREAENLGNHFYDFMKRLLR